MNTKLGFQNYSFLFKNLRINIMQNKILIRNSKKKSNGRKNFFMIEKSEELLSSSLSSSSTEADNFQECINIASVFQS